jgi:polyhydroxyalkanoate synthesis regulator phasin
MSKNTRRETLVERSSLVQKVAESRKQRDLILLAVKEGRMTDEEGAKKIDELAKEMDDLTKKTRGSKRRNQ